LYLCRSPRPTSTACSAPWPITRAATSSAAAINAEEGVVELASHYPMSFAAIQKHVAILERAGLVTKERIGRRKVVRTNLERLRVARRLLDQYEELWRGRIDRMVELISDPKETDR
jgi:DNA-binding transcriptional ArsR family regulator